jgi:hypothetical protein
MEAILDSIFRDVPDLATKRLPREAHVWAEARSQRCDAIPHRALKRAGHIA